MLVLFDYFLVLDMTFGNRARRRGGQGGGVRGGEINDDQTYKIVIIVT
jgi:hypothetical protein